MKVCAFCSEFSELPENNLFRQITFPDFSNRIIWEDEDFVIIPTIGCFLEGYLLLMPKQHIASFSAIDKNKVSKLTRIYQKIIQILSQTYNCEIVTFEHGSVWGCNVGGGGCEDHAHIHFIPSSIPYSQYAEKYFKISKISGLGDLSSYEEKYIPYLYFSDPNGDMFVCEAGSVVSQFFRRITTEHLNLGNIWRWQDYPFVELMQDTHKKLKPFFQNFTL